MRAETPPGRLNTAPAVAQGRGDWRDQALCRNATPSLFDAEENDRRSNPRIARAIEICEACPAIQDCLNDAMEHEGDARPANRHTIRGATLPSERAAAYRREQVGDWVCQLCTKPAPAGEPLCAACGEGVSAGQASYNHGIQSQEVLP